MKYRRYGRFELCDNISDYSLVCISIVIWGFIAIDYLRKSEMESFKGLCLIFTIFVGIPFLFIEVSKIKRYSEWFIIEDNAIVTKTEKILIPANSVIIITHACVRIFGDIHPRPLKNKYAISILKADDMYAILQKTHMNKMQYHNISIREDLAQYYLYDCVCDQSLLHRLIKNGTYRIIIQSSINNKFVIDTGEADIYVDNCH